MAGPLDLGQLTLDILQVVIILLLTYVVVRVFRVAVRRAGGQVPSGLVASLQQIGAWAIWIVGIVVILAQLQVNTSILLLVLGLGGLAVIVAYQGILGDIGAAQFISNYQAFKVGESPDNEVVIIPNSLLLKNSVVNRTRSGGLRVQVPVFVRAGTDLKTVEEKLVVIGEELKVDLVPDSAPSVRVLELNNDGARLVLILHIANPAKRDQVISDVQRRVYELLPDMNSWQPKP